MPRTTFQIQNTTTFTTASAWVETTTTSIGGLSDDILLTQGFNDNSQRTSLKADIGETHDFENLYSYNPLNQLSQVVQQSQWSGNVVADKHARSTTSPIINWPPSPAMPVRRLPIP